MDCMASKRKLNEYIILRPLEFTRAFLETALDDESLAA